MPIYQYKGYHLATGAKKKGKIEADSIRAARQKLKSKEQIVASDLKEEISNKEGQSLWQILTTPILNAQDIAIMTRQFATLQVAQLPLDEALRALTEQVEHPVLQNTLSSIKEAVAEGKSLAEAMQAYPNVFNRLYVNMVKAGESAGNLGEVLKRLADLQEYQLGVNSRVVGAALNPMITLVMSLGIIFYLFMGVVPKLQKVFSSLKVKLPWYSELILGLSDFINKSWPVLLVSSVLFSYGFWMWARSSNGQKKWDELSLKIPVFGGLILRLNISTFTRTLATLLSSGVPIIVALEIAKNIIGNYKIAEVVESAKIAVQEGNSLGGVLEKSGRFPALVSHMIKTGEKTGELETMLNNVATIYDMEVSQRVDKLIAAIQPSIMILMAGIIVGTIFSLLMPMFSLMNQIRA